MTGPGMQSPVEGKLPEGRHWSLMFKTTPLVEQMLGDLVSPERSWKEPYLWTALLQALGVCCICIILVYPLQSPGGMWCEPQIYTRGS